MKSLLDLFECAACVQMKGIRVGWIMIVLGFALLVATMYILAVA